jgi:hypothetical protein
MSRAQKAVAALVVLVAWFFTHDGLLILVGAACGFRTFADKSEPAGSWKSAATYAALIVALTALSLMRLHAPIR